jgi:hypothetical protein
MLPGVPGTAWLFLGGAVSVDRAYRTAGWDWFPEEVPGDAQLAAAADGGPADVVVAHEAPAGGAWLGRRLRAGAADWPEREIVAAGQFQKKLRLVFDAVRPGHWWHGHHHIAYEERLDGAVIHGLACDEMPLFELTHLVDAYGRSLEEGEDA